MFMEYWVDLGINIWKNGRKTHILGIFVDLYWYTFGPVPVQPSRTAHVPVQVRAVPVQVVFCFSILTRVRMLAISCSFMIRFEIFKFLVKIDFKENQTFSNRYLQIMTLGGPKIHSMLGYVQANFPVQFLNID